MFYDIRNYGLILLELFTCELPYKELTTLQAWNTHHPPDLLLQIKDQDIFSLIADCLNPKLSSRATLTKLEKQLDDIYNDTPENLSKQVAMFTDD